MALYKRRRFAYYEEAKAFRATRIRQGYKTTLAKDWQGLYCVEWR